MSLSGPARTNVGLQALLQTVLSNSDAFSECSPVEAYERLIQALRLPDSGALLDRGEFEDICNRVLGSVEEAAFTNLWAELDLHRRGFLDAARLADHLCLAAAPLGLCRGLHGPRGPRFCKPGPRGPSRQGIGKAGTAGMAGTGSRLLQRPAPGLAPGGTTGGPRPTWDDRFSIDLSERNLSFRGNMRRKTFFSRPQSLPELRHFFARHSGFQSQLARLEGLDAPRSGTRHEPDGVDRAAWSLQEPRTKTREDARPGSLLLRVPGPPPPFLYLGRDA